MSIKKITNLDGVLSITKTDTHKIFNILGLKLKFARAAKRQSNVNLEQNLNKISKTWLDSKSYWWKGENFEYFLDNPELKNKYQQLIDGLDKESLETISLIISRIQAYKTNGSEYFILTTREKKERQICEEFLSKIIRLSDDCWAYDNYLLPQKDMEISVLYYKHGMKYIKNLDKIKNKDIIDVGGYIGDSALVFSDYTSKNVHTFEPIDALYDKLLKTIELNNLKNIIPNKIALGAENKIEVIICDTLGSAIESIANNHHTDIPKMKINVTTLDEYVEKNNINVGLIKVDIEGYEQEFLKGAINTIKTQKPALIISIYHNHLDFFDIKPFVQSLNLGYKFKVVKPFNYTIITETILIAEVED